MERNSITKSFIGHTEAFARIDPCTRMHVRSTVDLGLATKQGTAFSGNSGLTGAALQD